MLLDRARRQIDGQEGAAAMPTYLNYRLWTICVVVRLSMLEANTSYRG